MVKRLKMRYNWYINARDVEVCERKLGEWDLRPVDSMSALLTGKRNKGLRVRERGSSSFLHGKPHHIPPAPVFVCPSLLLTVRAALLRVTKTTIYGVGLFAMAWTSTTTFISSHHVAGEFGDYWQWAPFLAVGAAALVFLETIFATIVDVLLLLARVFVTLGLRVVPDGLCFAGARLRVLLTPVRV